MANNENKYLGSQDNTDVKIDIIDIFVYGWRILKKTWWQLIVLFILSVGIVWGYRKFFYTPEYTASASFAVTSGGISPSYDSKEDLSDVSVAQLEATFPYILVSSALKEVVCQDMGVASLPGTISAASIGNTNLFQIKVVSADPEMASRILDSVIENYPVVAKYVIGNTKLTMLDNSGVPLYPSNRRSFVNDLTKVGGVAVLIYLVIVVITAMMRKTVAGEKDLKDYINIQCLTYVPKISMKRRSDDKKQHPLLGRKESPGFIEAMNTLRIRTLRRLKENKKHVVMITSSSEGEGKTTIVSNLALFYAMKGYRTLLIDGDLRNPSVKEHFDLENTEGIDQILMGNRKAEELIVTYEDTGLDILPGGQGIKDYQAIRLLNSIEMDELIEECRRKYDYIFIDTPPCGLMQDAVIMTRIADSAIMVVRQDYAARNVILDGMERISETDVNILGYVINYEEMSFSGYGYGRYGYGKYSKYGYGYGEENVDKESKKK